MLRSKSKLFLPSGVLYNESINETKRLISFICWSTFWSW